MEEHEEWREIPGYPKYQASNLGRVRVASTGHVLSTRIGTRGYINANLRPVGEKARCVSVHRLVLAAFIGDAPDMQARHIDGCKSNNVVTNLAWGTWRENESDKERSGTSYYQRAARGETAKSVALAIARASRKLTEEQVREMRALYVPGVVGPASLAKRFGVAIVTADRIVKGETWRWVGP